MVPVIAVAGIAMAWVLTGADTTALTETYGEFLLAKLAIFIAHVRCSLQQAAADTGPA